MENERKHATGMCGRGYESIFSHKQLPGIEASIRTLQRFILGLKHYYSLTHTTHVVTREAEYIPWIEQCVPLIRPGFFGETYQEELATVLSIFKRTFSLQLVDMLSANSTEHPVTPTNRSLNVLDMLYKSQGCPDILIVPAQMGREYVGKSMDWVASHYSTHYREFGFRLLDVLVMLLACPERLSKQIMIDCIGDVCSVSGVTDHSPVLHWTKNYFVLTYRPRNDPSSTYGAATGCAPPVGQTCFVQGGIL